MARLKGVTQAEGQLAAPAWKRWWCLKVRLTMEAEPRDRLENHLGSNSSRM